jgi:hypothetical protein
MGSTWVRVICTAILGGAVVGALAGAARPDMGVGDATSEVLEPGAWSHAFAVFGAPKYPAGFAHYDYANPEAPKGGTLNLGNPDRRSSFSRLNPYLDGVKQDGRHCWRCNRWPQAKCGSTANASTMRAAVRWWACASASRSYSRTRLHH